jgi:hypothetical protein
VFFTVSVSIRADVLHTAITSPTSFPPPQSPLPAPTIDRAVSLKSEALGTFKKPQLPHPIADLKHLAAPLMLDRA